MRGKNVNNQKKGGEERFNYRDEDPQGGVVLFFTDGGEGPPYNT